MTPSPKTVEEVVEPMPSRFLRGSVGEAIVALKARAEAAEAERDTLRTRVKRLTGALEPFAKISRGEPDTLMIRTDHPDFRRAERALKGDV